LAFGIGVSNRHCGAPLPVRAVSVDDTWMILLAPEDDKERWSTVCRFSIAMLLCESLPWHGVSSIMSPLQRQRTVHPRQMSKLICAEDGDVAASPGLACVRWNVS
jgi:hypothetical protein